MDRHGPKQNPRDRSVERKTSQTSFALDLKRWYRQYHYAFTLCNLCKERIIQTETQMHKQ